MTLDFIDDSGKPRSDADLQELVEYLTRTMVSARMTADPELIVLIPTALDLLSELQGFRDLVKKIKAKQAGGG